MASPVSLPRTLLIYAITIPLALILGYLLTTPFDMTSSYVMIAVTFVLVSPILLRSHYTLLLFSWNAWICVFFLPGRPFLWMLMVLFSLGFLLASHIMDRQTLFVHVPSITWPLVFLMVVIVLTAKIRGGIGIRVLGSSTYGGKGYVYLFFAIIGYFVLSSRAIPLNRAVSSIAWFFLPGITAVIGHLLYLAGPGAYFLFNFFPVEAAMGQAMTEATGGAMRLGGMPIACFAILCFLLAKHGFRGFLHMAYPWRILTLFALVGLTATGGYRSSIALVVLLLTVQFVSEGLMRTKLLPISIGVAALSLGIMIPFAPHMPLSVQRAMSFLPLDIDPSVKWEALESTNWRLDMWKAMMPDLPNYIFLGKGYTLNPTDIFMTIEAQKRGLAASYQVSAVAGDYHSGPLSIFVPFGSLGVLGFCWFVIASVRMLYRNMRFGNPALQSINTLLYALFMARLLMFIFVYGAFYSDLYHFTGIVGLSVALNAGERRAPVKEPLPALEPAPA